MASPRLLAINPPDRKLKEYILSKPETTVGSDPANMLVLHDPSVSRRHAVIRYRDGRCEVTDLNSTNGTFLNDVRIGAQSVIRDGDELRFGAIRFAFLDPTRAFQTAIRASRRTRKLSIRARIELFVILFAIGFAAMLYWLNRALVNEAVSELTGYPEESAVVPTQAPSPVAAAAPTSLASPTPTPIATPVATPPPAPTPAPTAPPAPTAAPAPRPRPAISRAPAALEIPPAPAPTEAEAPPSGPEPDWLARLNYYRKLANLAPVRDDPTLSDGDYKHARYLVENYGDAIRSTGGALGATMHREDESKSWYTPEGFAAAKHSDVYNGCFAVNPVNQVDGWMIGPFHRMSLLNPTLTRAGYGMYEKRGCWSAALDVHIAQNGRPFAEPVEFPPSGTIVPLASFDGREWPAPLTSCPGYSPPIGLPITLALGYGADAVPTAHSLTQDGLMLDHCVFDSTSYVNPDASAQQLVRMILKGYGAIVMIPRAPLTPGANYSVSITARGQTYNWSFTVSPDARGPR